MFKVSTGWRIFQHWSEVISFQISQITGGPACAPCFIAWDSKSNEVGVVVEFFYGHPQSGVPARFLAGADLMRRAFEDFDSDTDGTHTWQNVQLICDAFQIQDPVSFWARLLAFDALIGNTDRHSENWGVLAHLVPGTNDLNFTMAPAFDHGTSLAYQVRESDLARESTSASISKHVARGTHHLRFSGQQAIRGHFDLCQIVAETSASAKAAVAGMTTLSIDGVKNVLNECCAFRLPEGVCSQERADYLIKLIEARRTALTAIIKV
ncbi:HipA domain-containing protein [Bradyrhizobium erythrophlei]|nr:HipA domain-containing protein [Bradyrhizobium erythrophlei]